MKSMFFAMLFGICIPACGPNPIIDCDYAIGAMYSGGCYFGDGSGGHVDLDNAQSVCRSVELMLSDVCQDEFAYWLECVAAIAGKDCSVCNETFSKMWNCS